MKPLRAVLLLTLTSSRVFASNIDSLKTILNSNPNDSVECAVFNELSYEYYLYGDEKKALTYAQKAYEKAKALRNPKLTMRSLGQMGNAYMQQKKNLKAIECFIKSSRYAEKFRDSARMSAINHNIAILYMKISKNALARKYLSQSLTFTPTHTNPEEIAISKNLLGSLYYGDRKLNEAFRAFKEALDYYKKGEHPNRSAHAYLNLGIVTNDMGQYRDATKYFMIAHEKFVLLKDNVRAGQSLFRLAHTFLLMKRYDEAFGFHRQAMRYFKLQLSAASDFSLKKYLEDLGKAYMNTGNVSKANEVLTLTIQLYEHERARVDSIIDSEREQAFADAAIKYDTEETEQKNKIQQLTLAKQEADLKQQKLYVLIGVGGAILLAGLVFLFWRSSHITKKSNKKIEAQKTQIEHQRDEIQAKNHEITASIEYAKSLQAAILPFDYIIKKYLPSSFILWLPRDIVSGDFYWFYEKDDILYYAVADCTGHGVPGAFVSITCHNILNQVVIDKGFSDPGEILTQVNIQVCHVFKFDESGSKAMDGMDIVFCKINKSTRIIEFAGASNPLILVRNGEVTEYKTDKMPIGGYTLEGYTFTTHKVQSQPNDWIYLYSDGYKDQFGGETDKKLRSKNFIKLLCNCSFMPPNEQRQYLYDFLEKWQGGFERVDDVLVTGFKMD